MKPDHYVRSPKAYACGAERMREMIRAFRCGEVSRQEFVLMLFVQTNGDSERQGLVAELAEHLFQALELLEAEGIECP